MDFAGFLDSAEAELSRDTPPGTYKIGGQARGLEEVARNMVNPHIVLYRVGRSIVDCFLRTRRRRYWGL